MNTPSQLALFPPPGASLRHRDRKQIWHRDHDGQPSVQIGRYAIESIRDIHASAWLAQHHYLGGKLPGRGFYHGVRDLETGNLVGISAYGPGGGPFSRPAAFPTLFEKHEHVQDGKRRRKFIEKQPRSCMVLDRFGLTDEVPANAETHILKLSFARAREEHGMRALLSFSDPVARTTRDGRVMFVGHCGMIYRGKGALFTGFTRKEKGFIFDDSTVLPARSLTAWRNDEGGHEYLYDELLAQGAQPIYAGESKAEWLARVLPNISRPFVHTGQLRYCFVLDRAVELGPTLVVLPYPAKPQPAERMAA